jgi:hypothetical protein
VRKFIIAAALMAGVSHAYGATNNWCEFANKGRPDCPLVWPFPITRTRPTNGDDHKLWVGDKWRCPGCGHEIVRRRSRPSLSITSPTLTVRCGVTLDPTHQRLLKEEPCRKIAWNVFAK